MHKLTAGGKGKFWDLIYRTDSSGRVQVTLVGQRLLPSETIFFTDSTVTHYHIFDSIKIIELNKVSGDIEFGTSYSLNDDTLHFNGTKFVIEYLTDDTLKLKSPVLKRIQRVYVKSKFQHRVVIDNYPN